ncbi:CDP-glycerol glycerophosphotransferase family protein [Herbiconiux sp. SYSU D00978]|uniref:CDP-glycerol glycerophosphotransferase family protein n=1 Tax=Herbiconiux sp. SYSU D00978 TaxID=2812562 RepID=UPI001A95EB96|nr:CDP-glycerol glycerophosphotransferase family protein [Herbiconiux sp. SYSU D00978]
MPRFTFARGNAIKVLALPLYGIGAVATRLVRRDARRWAVGCGTGVGEGALQLVLAARRADPALDIVWLARHERDQTDAAAHGIRSVRKATLRGWLATARAGVLVVTHGFGDVNRFATAGAFLVQLWHGVPLKRVHLDSTATTASGLRSRLLARALTTAYRLSARSIDLLPAASETAAARLRTAFGLPADRVPVTGDPRDDVLAGHPDALRQTARELLHARLGRPLPTRVVLWAPTWRDGRVDPALPTDEEWRALDSLLARHDALLVVRPHPLAVGDFDAGPRLSDRVAVLDHRRQGDLMPVLAAAELLVTDYSSTALDFALTPGTVLFLAPDLEDYARTRGLYEHYSHLTGGHEQRSWQGLIALVDRLFSDPEAAVAHRAHTASLAERYFAFRDGRNAERVHREIERRA